MERQRKRQVNRQRNAKKGKRKTNTRGIPREGRRARDKSRAIVVSRDEER